MDKSKSNSDHLADTYRQYPRLSQARAALESLDAELLEIESNREKMKADLGESFSDDMDAAYDQKISITEANKARVERLISYAERKRSQTVRLENMDKDLSTEDEVLRKSNPETNDDRVEIVRRRRELQNQIRLALQALELLETPVESVADEGDIEQKPFRESIEDFFDNETEKVAKDSDQISLGDKQVKDLAKAFGDPVEVRSFMRSKEFLTIQSKIESRLDALKGAQRVYAQTEYAKILAISDPKQREAEFEGLMIFIQNIMYHENDTARFASNNIMMVGDARNRGYRRGNDNLMKVTFESMDPGAKISQESTSVRSFDHYLRYRLTTMNLYDMEYCLASYALFSLYRSGKLVEIIHEDKLKDISDQLSEDKITDTEANDQIDQLRKDVAFTYFGKMFAINPGLGYLTWVSQQHGKVKLPGNEFDAEIKTKIERATEAEMKSVAAELVPTINAVDSENRPGLINNQFGIRVDTQNGNIESGLDKPEVATLNQVGRVVHAAVKEQQDLRAKEKERLEKRRAEIDKQIAGDGSENTRSISDAELLADSALENIPLNSLISRLLEAERRTATAGGNMIDKLVDIKAIKRALVEEHRRYIELTDAISEANEKLNELGIFKSDEKKSLKNKISKLEKERDDLMEHVGSNSKFYEYTNGESVEPQVLIKKLEVERDKLVSEIKANHVLYISFSNQLKAAKELYAELIQEAYGTARLDRHMTDRYPFSKPIEELHVNRMVQYLNRYETIIED